MAILNPTDGVTNAPISPNSGDFQSMITSSGTTRLLKDGRIFTIKPARWHQIFPYQIVMRIKYENGGPKSKITSALDGINSSAGSLSGSSSKGEEPKGTSSVIYTLPIPPESI